MSAKLELRWLNIKKTKGAAKRFAEFCKKDVQYQAQQNDFNLEKYQDAVRLIIRKLDNTELLKEVFNPEQESEQKAEEKASNAN